MITNLLLLLSWRRLARSGALLALFVASAANGQSPASVQECEHLVSHAEGQNASPAREQAKLLESQGRHCVGKSAYDINLAFLYLDAAELTDADRVARRGLKAGSAYAPNLRQVLAETTLRRGDRATARQMAEAIAKDYPTYVPVLGLLAEFAMAERRWGDYLALFEKARDLSPGKALPLLGMAVALHQLDRHEECIALVYQALQLEPERIRQITGVKDAIFSLGILKRNQEAAQLLKRHMDANPQWARDPGMVSAAKALHLIKQ